MDSITVELIERFSEKWQLNDQTGCWDWTASLNANGYGQIKQPGKRVNFIAHRLSYLIHYGAIPDGMSVCHTCDNPKCVKPSHLFLGSQQENLLDMARKGRSTMHNAKIDEEKAFAIHKMAAEGMSQAKIGKAFGIGQQTVWKILRGLRWRSVYEMVTSGGQVTAAPEK
ncbi:MAG: HNH endonuclease [Desulfofustis sp.]|jgi:predicted DNA-binding protein (UPF0251 family)|nr:HNH endonuclease [Desulfofustis sp.]